MKLTEVYVHYKFPYQRCQNSVSIVLVINFKGIINVLKYNCPLKNLPICNSLFPNKDVNNPKENTVCVAVT